MARTGQKPHYSCAAKCEASKRPRVLEPKEIQGILTQLEPVARLIAMLAVTTGLRRSELFGLKWADVNFSNMEISVQRSIYLGTVGNCKTETSRKPVLIDERVAA
jgi:integrase